MNKAKLCAAILLPFFLAVTSGCHRSPLVQAQGRLTYMGKPVPSTYVIFHPVEEGKRESHGLTDDNGRFSLTFSRTDEGVLPGTHKVFLRYDVSVDEELGNIPPKANKELPVIDRYGVTKQAPLTYEVKGGDFRYRVAEVRRLQATARFS